jgi:glycosyltransferase involved in cell wall biosynthesis
MRIFYITHTFSLSGGGGGEVFCSNFLRELAKRGHRIFVFTTRSADFSKQERELGIRVFHAPSLGHHALWKFEYLLFAWKAARLAREFGAEIVHAQNDVFPALIGERVSKALGTPLLVSVEYLSDKAVSLNLKLTFLINKLFLPKIKFKKIVSWSRHTIDSFLVPWGIPREKIELIPGGIDTAAFSPNAVPSKKLQSLGSKLIVSAKPLHKTNAVGISHIIRAMRIVRKKHPDWKYVVVGEGTSQFWLFKLVKELGLEDTVFFSGALPSSEIPMVYSAARIVCHSFAFKATTSVALMESMACGKAIVATDCGEVKNTVKGSALLVKPNDPESIASGIVKLIENPALRRELGKKARIVAEKNYGIGAIATRFEGLYQKMLE